MISLAGAAASIIFVTTKVCLPRQNFCCDKMFVSANVFVATKMILVAAPTNDKMIIQSRSERQEYSPSEICVD